MLDIILKFTGFYYFRAGVIFYRNVFCQCDAGLHYNFTGADFFQKLNWKFQLTRFGAGTRTGFL
jgi:hypothetical protein